MPEEQDTSLPEVELTTAYEWICDNCGVANFCSSAKLDMSDEQNEQALREAFEIEDWQEIPEDLAGEWCTRPSQVTCEHCGTTYKASEPS